MQGQDLRLHLDERHIEPLAAELLGGLEAHVATADHHRPLRIGHGLRDAVRVLEVAQREHALGIHARDGRLEGSAPGARMSLS